MPEGRCIVFDKYTSDTCKAATGACGSRRPAAARTGERALLGARAAAGLTQTAGEAVHFPGEKLEWGRRPAGGSAHTAGLRPGFHCRDAPSRAGSVPAEPSAGSAGPQAEDPPLRCGPKEQKWPREERDEPRSCRRTDRRACAFPTPPALAARASPGGAGGWGSRSLRRLGFQSRCFLFKCCSAIQWAPRAITCARRSPCQSALEHL